MRWLTSEVDFVRWRSGAELVAAFAMATFQASLLVLAILLGLFRAGDLGEALADFDTAFGVAAFLWLWLTGFYSTVKALSSIDIESRGMSLEVMLPQGMKWGGVNGALFFLGLVIVILVLGAIDFDAGGEPAFAGAVSALLFAVVFALAGAAVAFLFGAAIGFLFALVYAALLPLAKAVAAAR